jgi:DNA-binding LacI/PurR family transcriptional regulator
VGVSIRDVAKAAGVSTATVSRIINNSPLISPETRDRTLKVMEELNYVPNSLARALSNQKSFNVTLLIDIADVKSFSNPFFYEVMHGIETVVYKKGLCLTIASTKNSDKKTDILDWLIHGKRMQGLIIPVSLADETVIEKLEEMRFPFVLVGEPQGPAESVHWVDIHNRQGGQMAVSHLAANGYRNIGLIVGNKNEKFNRNRLAGYLDALAQNGMTVREEYIKESNGTKQDAYEKMKELLALDIRPDAVIGGDNILCYGAMKAVKEAGLHIPSQVGIVSFDDYPLAELLEPSLTAVVIDVFELGVLAADTLLNMLDDPESKQQQYYIPTCIKERESTKR